MTTILIVDDSSFSRGRLRAAFANSDFQLVEAVNGVDALAKLQEQPIDFMITDLLMPEMDGFQLIKRIRDDGRSIPALVVSADIQQTSKQLCLEMGIQGFINKPFQAQELRQKVDEVLTSLVH